MEYSMMRSRKYSFFPKIYGRNNFLFAVFDRDKKNHGSCRRVEHDGKVRVLYPKRLEISLFDET